MDQQPDFRFQTLEQAQQHPVAGQFADAGVQAGIGGGQGADRRLHAQRPQAFDIVRQVAPLLSDDHFSVDGTLLEAWASHKSFQPKDAPRGPMPPGRNAEVDFHGERRTNQTHASTTDPEALMARKSMATAAKLSYAGHLLMEHRNALIVDIELTQATGYAERDTALEMLRRLPPTRRRRTLAGDKAYDTRGFVKAWR